MYVEQHEEAVVTGHVRWNKGKLVGLKPPLKLKEIWAIRIRLQLAHRVRVLSPIRPGY